jgi:hypothetical protein
VEDISTSVASLSAIATALAGAAYVLGLIALAWLVYKRITKDTYTALYAVSLIPKTVVIGQGLRIMLGTALMGWGLRIAFFFVAFIVIPIIAVALLGGKGIGLVLDSMELSGTPLGETLNRAALQIVSAAIVLCSLGLLGKLEAAAGRLETTRFFHFLYLKPGAQPPPFKAVFIVCGILGGIGGVIAGTVVYGFQYAPGWWTFIIVLVAVFLIAVISGVPYALSLTNNTPLPKVRVTMTGAENEDDSENEADSRKTEGQLVAHSEGVFYVFEGPILTAVPDGTAKIIRVP